MSEVVIDASNLHGGGAVQVAASFLDEFVDVIRSEDMIRSMPWLARTRVELSDSVAKNMSSSFSDHSIESRIVNRSWSSVVRREASSDLAKLRFTVFGPFYGRRSERIHIMGFADGLLIAPPSIQRLANRERGRWKTLIRTRYARHSFVRADHIVVETDAVRDRFEQQLGYPSRQISVVPNCVNSIFFRPDEWIRVDIQDLKGGADVVLAYLARAHSYKNFDILGRVALEFRERYSLKVVFVVSLSSDEWSGLSEATREACVNLGPVKIQEVPSILSQTDGIFFPSLYESFSASPLEAMAIGIPVYASDRDFVRNTCGAYPTYFDPCDPISAARAIAGGRLAPLPEARVEAPSAVTWTARDRAQSYFAIISSALEA